MLGRNGVLAPRLLHSLSASLGRGRVSSSLGIYQWRRHQRRRHVWCFLLDNRCQCGGAKSNGRCSSHSYRPHRFSQGLDSFYLCQEFLDEFLLRLCRILPENTLVNGMASQRLGPSCFLQPTSSASRVCPSAFVCINYLAPIAALHVNWPIASMQKKTGEPHLPKQVLGIISVVSFGELCRLDLECDTIRCGFGLCRWYA